MLKQTESTNLFHPSQHLLVAHPLHLYHSTLKMHFFFPSSQMATWQIQRGKKHLLVSFIEVVKLPWLFQIALCILGTNACYSSETLGQSGPLMGTGNVFSLTRVAGQPRKVQTSISKDVTLLDFHFQIPAVVSLCPSSLHVGLVQFPPKSSKVTFGRWAGRSRPSMALSWQKH